MTQFLFIGREMHSFDLIDAVLNELPIRGLHFDAKSLHGQTYGLAGVV